jgi:hypothetical protein
MEQMQRIFGDERFVTGKNGTVESVLLSIAEYSKIVDFLEDQKLVDFFKEAEAMPILSKEEALKYLGKSFLRCITF